MSATPDAVQLEQIAKQVLTTSLGLKRGESVIVESWTHMLPWARAFVQEARKLGIRPMLLYEDEGTYWNSVENAKPSDIGRMSAPEMAALSKTNGYVFLWGPEDRPRLSSLPSEQNSALLAYNSDWYKAAEKAHLRGCRIELGRATGPAAKFFGVNETMWQHSLIEGSLVDFKTLARDGARLAAKLAKGRALHITHANGTDLELKLAGRKPVLDDGIVDAEDVRTGNNMTSIPGGAVYVAVDEKYAVGRVVANRTSYPSWGALKGGRWMFQDNRLAKFEYASGGETFAERYEKAAAGKERPGFVSIGLNPRVRDAPGLEDFERATVLFGVGANAAFGGKTKIPFQTWLGLGAAHVDVDGKAVVADGEIL